jgi:drug/metabolite transporter, DME family
VNSSVLFGELSALADAVTWALASVQLTRLNRKINVFTIGAVRGLAGLVFFLAMLPFVGGLGSFAGVTLGTVASLVAALVTGQILGDTTLLVSARRIGMARTMPIAMAYPLFTFVLAAIFLHEPLSLSKLAGATVILAGVYLLSSGSRVAPTPSGRLDVWGIVLALLTALLWAAGGIFLQPASRVIDPVPANCIRQALITVMFFAIMPRSQGTAQLRALGRGDWIWLISMSLLSSGLGSLLFLWAYRFAGASISSALAAASPVISTPLSVWMLREKLSWRILAGTVLILAGIWIVILL